MSWGDRKIRRKHRGTRSCGRGRKGSRNKAGGRGLGGGQKHKKSYIYKYMPDHFGADSMHIVSEKPDTTNIGYLNDLAVKRSINELNAIELGYPKVLGGGKVTKALKVTAERLTEKAKKKLEAAGGSYVETKPVEVADDKKAA